MIRATALVVAATAAFAGSAAAAKPLPDLIVTSVSGIPSHAVGGTKISIRDKVVNRGTATARASQTAFYLSIDGRKDAKDIKLDGMRRVRSLKAGKNSGGKTTVTVPSNLSGLFEVIACADGGRKVKESREGNNCKTAARGITISVPPPAN